MRRDLEERKAAGGEPVDGDDPEQEQHAEQHEVEQGAMMGEDGAPMDRRAHEKAAAAAARAAVREAQEAAEALKAKKADKYSAKHAAREAEREAEAAEAARLDALRAEEQAKKDAAEFDQWKDMFTVSDSGSAAAASEEESQSQLEEFVQYIKTRKVVVLDDVAAFFKIKTPVSQPSRALACNSLRDSSFAPLCPLFPLASLFPSLLLLLCSPPAFFSPDFIRSL